MKTFYAFGNELIWDEGSNLFFVNSTGMVLDKEVYKDLICPRCGKKSTDKGHDPCIPDLPGVDFACCGHGVKAGYVKFTNGVILTGRI